MINEGFYFRKFLEYLKIFKQYLENNIFFMILNIGKMITVFYYDT